MSYDDPSAHRPLGSSARRPLSYQRVGSDKTILRTHENKSSGRKGIELRVALYCGRVGNQMFFGATNESGNLADETCNNESDKMLQCNNNKY